MGSVSGPKYFLFLRCFVNFLLIYFMFVIQVRVLIIVNQVL
jgi:hypothetical protein